MKLVFICGSIEPGRDGVGDYIRRLAGELLLRGHTVAALSVNDRYINDPYSGSQDSEGGGLKVMRLPATLRASDRFQLAAAWLSGIDPEWLSLQYVPFAFSDRGLHAGLGKQLAVLGKHRRWHIMFHELWVGIALEESLKLRLWGALQRYLIKSLVLQLRPEVIHTQTPLYRALLKKLKFDSDHLPLFSNIPAVGVGSFQQRPAKELKAGILSFVVFGSIQSGGPVRQFAKEASLYAKKNHVAVSLTLLGRNGAGRERWVDAWRSEGLPVRVAGERSTESISEILRQSTIGICTTAAAAAEKSGSFAAMREHGLPVICISKSWTPRGVPVQSIPEGMVEYMTGDLEKCIDTISGPRHSVSVPEVSEIFLKAFK